jgi:hypothetical protein
MKTVNGMNVGAGHKIPPFGLKRVTILCKTTETGMPPTHKFLAHRTKAATISGIGKFLTSTL